jgi:uncharacterized protein
MPGMGATNGTSTGGRPLAAVTGASSGLGAVFARKLASLGFDLILTARRADRLIDLAEEIRARFGAESDVQPADLARDADVTRLADHLAGQSDLEVLVNNAGFGTLGLFHETDRAGQDAMARVHVLAPLRITHAVLPNLLRRGRGSIINVASVAAFFRSPANVAYCSTKAWLKEFTEGLAIELEGTGVRPIALCPGLTYSEFHDRLGVDRATVDDAWWLTAEFVVDQCFGDLDRGRILSIPGLRYKFLVLLARTLPRKLLNAMAWRRYHRMHAPAMKEGEN